MGVVYAARDPVLARDVAVKLIPPGILSEETETRFRREAQILAAMDHPCIVGIYDAGKFEDALYIVMPLVRGETLRQRLMKGKLQLGEMLEIAIQTTDALEYSHSKGVVHRDIKPENILLAQGERDAVRVRITDFGLAIAPANDRLTRSGAVVGTAAYLSPEAVQSREIDGRSDIYSLGTVLYECVAGQPPFAGNLHEVMYRIIRDIPLGLRATGLDVDPELDSLLLQCLQKDAALRPMAVDLSASLRQYRDSLPEDRRTSAFGKSEARIRPPLGGSHSVFIGREKEFAELQLRLASALQSECQLVLISGDPGIGKTRLLEELERLAQARRIRTIHGRLSDKDQSFPYQGFCDAILDGLRWRDSAGTIPDLTDLAPILSVQFPAMRELEEFRQALGRPPADSWRTEDRTLLFEALSGAVIRIAAGRPLIILLEELHEADVSLEALQYIVRRLGPTGTLIVGTYSAADVNRRHPLIRLIDSFQGDRRFFHMRLEPFLPSEHSRFVDALLGSSGEKDLAGRLYDITGGNAYFTKELVASLVDTGRLARQTSGVWALSGEMALEEHSLPGTIQEMVHRRTSRLNEAQRHVLSVAAVLGKQFDLRDLKAVTASTGDVEETVEALILEKWIEPEPDSRNRFAFISNVVREVIYHALPRSRRKSIHREYARHLETRFAGRIDKAVPQLQHHYTLADDPEKAIEYSLRLARSALDSFAAEDAIRAARTALDFLKEQDDLLLEAEARELLASAHRIAGNTLEAVQNLEAVIGIFRRENQPRRALGSMAAAAETAWEGRRVDEARRFTQAGLELARDLADTQTLSRMLSLAATICNLRGEWEQAQEYHRELELLRPRDIPEAELPSGGTLAVALAAEVRNIAPARLRIDEELEIAACVFETLTTMDAKGNLLPALAEKWEPLEGARAFRFTLRSNLQTHNGEIIDSEIVRASFEAGIRESESMHPAYATIVGADEVRQNQEARLRGFIILSPIEFRIDLNESLPVYPALVCDMSTAIAVQGRAGTGPFHLASQTTNSIQLERNSSYRGAAPKLDRVVFHHSLTAAEIASRFRSGEFDVVRNLHPEDLESLLRDRRLTPRIAESPKKNVYFALFHHSGPLGRYAALRQAMCGVLRIQDLVRANLGRFAQPADGLFPPGVAGHDAGRRRALMPPETAAALVQSVSGSPLKMKALAHPILIDSYSSFVRALQDQWAAIGIDVSFDAYAPGLAPVDLGEIDLLLTRWNASYGDPDDFTMNLFHSRTGYYRSYYSSTELDQWMEEARAESRPEAREKLYRPIENALLQQHVLLPMFHDLNYRLAAQHVKGMALRNVPPYFNYGSVARSQPEAAPRKRPGGILKIPVPGKPLESMDPSFTSTMGQSEVIPTIFECLTREADGARVIPWLAAEFHSLESGRRFYFRLREDIRFHDGRRVTARDVRFSFEHLLLNSGSLYRTMLKPIRGASDLLLGHSRDLVGFEIRSPHEFVIALDQPLALLPALLADPAVSIIPEGFVESGRTWQQGCVGTGPFRISNFEPGVRLELTPNPHYWRAGLPRSDGLIFSFGVSATEMAGGLRHGDYHMVRDLVPADVEILRRDPAFGAGYRELPRLCTYFAAFNTRRGPLQDGATRRRIVQSIHVSQMVNRSLGRLALPAHGIIPPGMLGYYPQTATGTLPIPAESAPHPEIELTFLVHPVYQNTYAALKDDLFEALRSAGFVPRVKEGDVEALPVLEAGDFDVALTRWFPDYPDTDSFAITLLHSKLGQEGLFCGNDEIDRIVDRARIETDPELRHHLYREMEQVITRRAVLLPLFHELTYRIARPEVDGYELVFSFHQPVPFEKLSLKS